MKTKSAAKSPSKAPASPLALTASAIPTRSKAAILASKVSFRGHVFSVTTDTVVEPGNVRATRDVVRHSGSVVILAVDGSTNPADPSILVERQYRHAAGQFLLELPAGRIDPGEKPLAAAKRELIEETGFRARRWSPLCRYYASPGFLAETMQVLLAEDLHAGVAEPEDDERIQILHIPLSELVKLIETGKVLDGKTIIATLLYARRRVTSL